MTSLEYMERQLQKHRYNLANEALRNAPVQQLENIQNKVRYYSDAVQALKEAESNG